MKCKCGKSLPAYTRTSMRKQLRALLDDHGTRYGADAEPWTALGSLEMGLATLLAEAEGYCFSCSLQRSREISDAEHVKRWPKP